MTLLNIKFKLVTTSQRDCATMSTKIRTQWTDQQPGVIWFRFGLDFITIKAINVMLCWRRSFWSFLFSYEVDSRCLSPSLIEIDLSDRTAVILWVSLSLSSRNATTMKPLLAVFNPVDELDLIDRGLNGLCSRYGGLYETSQACSSRKSPWRCTSTLNWRVGQSGKRGTARHWKAPGPSRGNSMHHRTYSRRLTRRLAQQTLQLRNCIRTLYARMERRKVPTPSPDTRARLQHVNRYHAPWRLRPTYPRAVPQCRGLGFSP